MNRTISQKILFLDHTAVLSGAELSMLNLVQRLDRTQCDPTVLLFADGPLADALRQAGVVVEILPLAASVREAGRGSLGVGALAKLGAIFASAAYIFRLARYIRRNKPDIVHCNCLKSDILGGIAARLVGVKIIWHIHDRIETDYLPGPVVKVFRLLARYVPHYIIANSQATLETLKLPPGKMCAVVYPGVPAAGKTASMSKDGLATEGTEDSEDGGKNVGLQVTGDRLQGMGDGGKNSEDRRQKAEVDRSIALPKSSASTPHLPPTVAGAASVSSVFSVATSPVKTSENLQPATCSPNSSVFCLPSSASASCLGGEKPSPVVVLIGRISPWKGQDIFIRAAAMVLKQFPACRFQIIGSALFGEDALEGQLKALAATLGTSGQVEFLGFRKDVPEIIANSTLLVHASTVPEPFGQVIVQAMAEGKPVVATRGGGVLEIVEDGVTGLLVPMKNVEAMAEAIGAILADPVLAEKMGEAGRARFLEKFTIETTVEKVQEVYSSRDE